MPLVSAVPWRRIQTLLDEPVDYYVGGRRGGYLTSVTYVHGHWRLRTRLH